MISKIIDGILDALCRWRKRRRQRQFDKWFTTSWLGRKMMMMEEDKNGPSR